MCMMAVAEAVIFNEEDVISQGDEHENDMVMPGFRFRPTEEELVEFYLRRKVEGKHFNIELITFVDLYQYDPWELPALAAIGEKEWYFYVPRDRKYRNGDRPNRLTASGYWKATGVDRIIRENNVRSIGVKKTLVFYAGKAPKGIRTGWIMNEYRLPQRETQHLQKGEISLCRVYKRAGIADPPSLPKKASWYSSRVPLPLPSPETENNSHGEGLPKSIVPSSTADIGPSHAPSQQTIMDSINPLLLLPPPPVAVSSDDEICHQAMAILYQSESACPPQAFPTDDLHRLVNSYRPHQQSASENHQYSFHDSNIPTLLSEFSILQEEPTLAQNAVPESLPEAFTDTLLDWSDNFGADGNDCSNLFMPL